MTAAAGEENNEIDKEKERQREIGTWTEGDREMDRGR